MFETLKSKLVSRPRAVGALFALTVLLAQAGGAAAALASTISGP